MSRFTKTEFERKNKNGKVLERVLNVQPKNGFVSIDEVNKTYKALIKKTDASKIMIKIQTIGGFLTAKSFDYVEEDLELLIDNYYSSLSKEGIDKFSNLLSFQIITRS